MNDWDAASTKRKTQLKDLVRRGIPHYLRAIVWQLLCGASEADKKQYADYIKATSACEKVSGRYCIQFDTPNLIFKSDQNHNATIVLFDILGDSARYCAYISRA